MDSVTVSAVGHHELNRACWLDFGEAVWRRRDLDLALKDLFCSDI